METVDREIETAGKIPIISFFTGGGFLDMGFIQAGFNVVWTNEFDSVFAQLYKEGITSWKRAKKLLTKKQECSISNTNSIKDIPDDMLIEKTLLHLDLEEINQLFLIYPFKKIKQVWLDYLVPQAEYLYTLNRCFAWYYFKAKKPDAYIKSMATRHLNKMFA